jgi:CspA family cold shock protein
MKMAENHDIFLSYSSLNMDKAAPLVESFARQGWTVWWDRRIQPGEFFDIELESALGSATVVVLLWSGAAKASTWVRAEAEAAASRKVLIPVRLDSTPLALHLRRIQSIDLSDWTSTVAHIGFRSLLGSLATRLCKPVVDDSPLPSVKDIYEQGLRAEQTGDVESAVKCFMRAMRMDPGFGAPEARLIALAYRHRTPALPIQKGTGWPPLGVVSWFNAGKGFGFVQPDSGGAPFFVHISALERSGLSALREGQGVEFIFATHRGKTAISDLRIIG